jgi:nitroreductase
LNQEFVAQAPLVVVGCIDTEIEWHYGERGKKLYTICDTAVSIQNLMLLSHEKGLGSVWIGAFDETEVAKILDLPNNLKPIAIVPIGYPAEKPFSPPRVSKSEAVQFIQ